MREPAQLGRKGAEAVSPKAARCRSVLRYFLRRRTCERFLRLSVDSPARDAGIDAEGRECKGRKTSDVCRVPEDSLGHGRCSVRTVRWPRVTLVVILGGAVLSLRLRSQGLPADAVVAVLPREFLISVGLG